MSAKVLQNRLAQQQSIDKASAAFSSIKNQLSSALLPLAEAFGAVFTVLGPVLKAIGFTIKTILSPITLISSLLSGTTKEMSVFQKIMGGILGTFMAIKVTTLALNGIAAARTAIATYQAKQQATEAGMTTIQMIKEKARNALSIAYNWLMSGRVGTKAAENAAEAVTTAQKGTQLGLQIGQTGAATATAGALTAAAAGQGALTGATAAGAGAGAAQAAAALTTNAAVTFGIGTVIAIAAAAAAIAGLIGYMAKAKKAGDIQSPARGKGKTMVSTKEGGLYETSKNDDVAAGPGILSRLSGAAQDPLGALGSLFSGGESKKGDMAKVEELLVELIAAAKTPPPVYIGDKAVTELNAALQINESFLTTKNATAGVG